MLTSVTEKGQITIALFGNCITSSVAATVEEAVGHEVIRFETLQHVVPVAVEIDQHLKRKTDVST